MLRIRNYVYFLGAEIKRISVIGCNLCEMLSIQRSMGSSDLRIPNRVSRLP